MNYLTELSKTQKKLRDIELALNESSIVAITDEKGIIQFANDKFCQVSQYSREELIGSTHKVINSGHHCREFFENLWQTIRSGKVWKGEVKNQAKDGTCYWLDSTIVPFLNEQGSPYQYIVIRHDITTRKQYEETIETIAYYDSVTTLPNRNALKKWFSNKVLQHNKSACVMFLDLDRFKSINDNFGHDTGDLILKRTANRLQSCLRRSDLIVRQGGDEFIVILDGNPSQLDVEKIADKLLQQLTLPIKVNDYQIHTSVSIGISMVKNQNQPRKFPEVLETLIKQADTAMYQAKNQGGNMYCFASAVQFHRLERYYLLEQALIHALDQNQFSLAYQPLFDLAKNKMIGVEALLRWHHPRLGKVTPAEFIPILEENGLIVPVGKWILESVCKQMKKWQRNGIYLHKVAVNVSAIQFRNIDFVKDLKTILTKTELEPTFLELEITEGVLLNIEKSAKVLKELKTLGVQVSIDDFGTGYSSLSYLKTLPIDTLKIDKSFIDHLDNDGEIIVNTIITMGKNLNFTVVAEGIENKYQLDFLKEQHCHQGQGYYWSKPVSDCEINQLLSEQH